MLEQPESTFSLEKAKAFVLEEIKARGGFVYLSYYWDEVFGRAIMELTKENRIHTMNGSTYTCVE